MVPANVAAVYGQKAPVMRKRMRPGPDKGHVARQDIEQLGQLSDAVPPKQAAQTRRAIIPELCLRDGPPLAGSHRAEFENVERPALKTSAPLAKQARTRRLQPDQCPYPEQYR